MESLKRTITTPVCCRMMAIAPLSGMALGTPSLDVAQKQIAG
jgi:hypothetical protein